MKPARKGRNFELYIHKVLKPSIPSLHIRAWSGTKANPGDLYTNKMLIDCKHVAGYSESDIRNWFTKISKEAMYEKKIPVIILKRSGTQSIQVILGARSIGLQHLVCDDIVRFYWKCGINILQNIEAGFVNDTKN